MSLTLAEYLRALPDGGLSALVAARPDLVLPVPADMSALAVRAQSRLSVARALDGLDRFTLEILDGVRLACGGAEPVAAAAVVALAVAGSGDAAAGPAALDPPPARGL